MEEIQGCSEVNEAFATISNLTVTETRLRKILWRKRNLRVHFSGAGRHLFKVSGLSLIWPS